MSIFLTLAFLFFIGAILGWGLEVFYRRFFSKANPERRWINPGFCTGPWLPLYGSIFAFRSELSIVEHLKEAREAWEERRRK